MRWTSLIERRSSNNATLATEQLLRQLHVPVTTTTLLSVLESHPYFPSLYSISDSLKKWKVDNLALEVRTDRLAELPVPFIAHLKNNGGHFCVVTDVKQDAIKYATGNNTTREKQKEVFLKEWSGTVLVAEASKGAGETNYKKKRRKEIWQGLPIPFILACCLCLIAGYTWLGWEHNPPVAWPVLAMLKLAGSIVTGLLLWAELDRANPVMQQICSGTKHTNCNAVLSSKGARLFNRVSWSEIGFVYFTGGLLFLLSSANNQLSSVSLLAWLNALALPYAIFSVIYQWKVVRQWCPLCLAVQALLALEAIVLYLSYWNGALHQPFDSSFILPAIFSFFLPVFFWLFTKPFLLSAQKAEQLQKEVNKLKYNPQLFQALLPKQKSYTHRPDGLGITLGNPNAANTVVKVCNPYCGPCAKAHAVIDEILENNEDIKVQIIFTATNNEKDRKALPVKHLMALYEKDDIQLMRSALDDWYGAAKKEYEVFASKYKLNGELQKQGAKLEAMDNWCRQTKISFTPTFFVNGYQLPEIYTVNDLQHLLT